MPSLNTLIALLAVFFNVGLIAFSLWSLTDSRADLFTLSILIGAVVTLLALRSPSVFAEHLREALKNRMRDFRMWKEMMHQGYQVHMQIDKAELKKLQHVCPLDGLKKIQREKLLAILGTEDEEGS